MRNFRKSLSIALIILCFIFIPMNVLAASPKKQLTNQTKKVLKACKNYDQKQLKKYIKSKDKFIFITDPEWNQCIREIKKHDKTKITDIEIDKNEAVVYVDIKTIDCYTIIADCLYTELHRKGQINTNRLHNDITNRLRKANSKWKKNQNEFSVELTYKKVKNTWMLSKIGDDVGILFDSRAARCLYDFTKNPFDFY